MSEQLAAQIVATLAKRGEWSAVKIAAEVAASRQKRGEQKKAAVSQSQPSVVLDDLPVVYSARVLDPGCGFVSLNGHQRANVSERESLAQWKAAMAAEVAKLGEVKQLPGPVVLRFMVHRQRSQTMQDAENIAPVFKALTDAIVETGLLEDDNDSIVADRRIAAGEPLTDEYGYGIEAVTVRIMADAETCHASNDGNARNKGPDDVMELLSEGRSYREIAKETGIPKTTVYRMVQHTRPAKQLVAEAEARGHKTVKAIMEHTGLKESTVKKWKTRAKEAAA